MTSQIVHSHSAKEIGKGIHNFKQFKNTLAKGNFSIMYIFIDGSYLKSRKIKLFYKKTKEFGNPAIVIRSVFLKNISDINRRLSIADDINQDLIWMQKSKN